MSLTNDQVYALVGRFLHDWALMESALNDALQTILQLDRLQGVIVCANVPFFNKTHILRTAIDQSRLDDERTTKFKKTIKDIQDISYLRNIVAHDLFMVSDDGKAIKFLVTKAKGSLKFPETVWIPKDFKKFSFQLINFACLLDEIGRETHGANQNLQGLAKALMDHSTLSEPISSNFEPRFSNLQWPQPQERRNLASLLATPQKDRKTRPASDD